MNYSLKPWNTFGIDRYANNIICVKSVEQLVQVYRRSTINQQPLLILGEGSNVLFVEDFNGTVVINRIMGIEITEDRDSWLMHVGAGENWHELVKFTLKNSIPGLENLALIPGCVGSSPIQNIGAYGIELKCVCQYVDCIELKTGNLFRLEANACRFDYRDSIFKHEYQNKFAIIAIGLRLLKRWKPILTYGDLVGLDPETVTPEQIFDSVCRMRMTKLPDSKMIGNAGSFFKNPIINFKTAKKLLTRWPNAPCFLQKNGCVKLSAGWLIDQCQLKGFSYGGASVYYQQALVLINERNATSEDILYLAHLVRQRVGKKFNIWLKPEVRFIGATGEVNVMDSIV